MANNIGVENEKKSVSVVLKDNLLGELDWTSGTKWLVLEGASDLDIVLLLKDFELLHHNLWLVVDGKDNFGNTGSCESLNLMAENREVAEVHQWLWYGQSQWSKSGSETTDEN